ncbi:MAG: magnesium chelatase, partial [Candidatus Limnocylindria bacterium]
YTSRGRIITPLKDRFGAQIRTHYPEETETEIAIMEGESATFAEADDGSVPVQVPGFMKEIVAELSQLARRSSEVSQRSGVSVRVTIANHETLGAAALKRAVRLGEPSAAPRISDLPSVVASTAGKIELETLGDETREDRVVEKLVARAVVNVFNRHFAISELVPLLERFEEESLEAEVGDMAPSRSHGELADAVPELSVAVARLDAGETPAGIASAVEFVLEGLHLNRRLNKERRGGGVRYAR